MNRYLRNTSKILITSNKYEHRVKWVPCYNGMARSQVADGGDEVAAVILNKQSRTADKGRISNLRVDREATIPRRKEIGLLRNVTKGTGLGLIIWINYLSRRKWT
jgi:hypothetical protein